MLATYDVVVIGAGMFGSAAAKYISRSNVSVAVIGPCEPESKEQAQKQQSFGAYYDEARITRRLGWDQVWGATDSRSLNRYREIEAEAGIPFFHEQGSLVLIAKSIARRTDMILSQCQENHIPVERVEGDFLQKLWPDFKAPDLSGGTEGLYERKMAGYLNPRKLVEAQILLTKKTGGTFIKGEVSQITKGTLNNLWHIRICGDNAPNSVSAKHILIATGSFTNYSGVLPPDCQLAINSFTEPNLLFELNEKDLERYRSLPTVITVDPDDTGNQNTSIYLVPPIQYPDGKWYMRIGPGMQPIIRQLNTLEDMRKWFIAQRITAQQREFLTRMFKMLTVDINPVSIREACCIIEKTLSHYPYLGSVNNDHTLHVVVGGNGHGARGSDEIGRLAANMVLDNEWDFPLPQSTFTPMVVANEDNPVQLKFRPPFGLC